MADPIYAYKVTGTSGDVPAGVTKGALILGPVRYGTTKTFRVGRYNGRTVTRVGTIYTHYQPNPRPAQAAAEDSP